MVESSHDQQCTCGTRLSYLRAVLGKTRMEAQAQLAAEFGAACGACDPFGALVSMGGAAADAAPPLAAADAALCGLRCTGEVDMLYATGGALNSARTCGGWRTRACSAA